MADRLSTSGYSPVTLHGLSLVFSCLGELKHLGAGHKVGVMGFRTNVQPPCYVSR